MRKRMMLRPTMRIRRLCLVASPHPFFIVPFPFDIMLTTIGILISSIVVNHRGHRVPRLLHSIGPTLH